MVDHLVKVPEDLVSQWWEEAVEARSEYWPAYVADRAAQWGADQELEACCEWLDLRGFAISSIDALRTARRPKPPTLAEQGAAALQLGKFPSTEPIKALRAALTRLAELEAQQ